MCGAEFAGVGVVWWDGGGVVVRCGGGGSWCDVTVRCGPEGASWCGVVANLDCCSLLVAAGNSVVHLDLDTLTCKNHSVLSMSYVL